MFDALLERDLWAIPIYPAGHEREVGSVTLGKEPIGKAWGLERWTKKRGARAYKDFPKAGVGVGLGPGRGPGGSWLGDVEGDGKEAEASRAKLFDGEIVETLGWGSARGGHQLLAVDGKRLQGILGGLAKYEVKNTPCPGVYHFPQLPGLELRLGGYKDDGETVKQIQSVTPPTLGTDGKPRRFNGCESIADAPEAFYTTLQQIADEAKSVRADTCKGEERTWSKLKPGDRLKAYFKGALDKSYGAIARAPQGERHPTVMSRTRALAGYLHYGDCLGFTEPELEDEMTRAADEAAPERRGDNRRCVRDAIADGKKHPLRLDDELHQLATGENGRTEDQAPNSAPTGADQRGTAQASGFPAPIPASQLRRTDPNTKWTWDGYVGPEIITLLSAVWKGGKSTLLAHLLRAFQSKGDIFCGQAIKPARILYITEEGEGLWADRRDKLGLTDNVHFLIRPFPGKADKVGWAAFVKYILDVLAENPADVIIFDPLNNLWPVKDENNAPEVTEALLPLRALGAGRAIILVHHVRKSDGAEGTASRGSGALPGFVDIIVEMRRYAPNNRTDRRRVLAAWSRYEETPAELVVELTAGGYVAHGDKRAVMLNKIVAVLNDILPTESPGWDVKTIVEEWPSGDTEPQKQMLYEVLGDHAAHRWSREGGGKRGAAYRYWKTAK
jgi:hypothetical protein